MYEFVLSIWFEFGTEQNSAHQNVENIQFMCIASIDKYWML